MWNKLICLRTFVRGYCQVGSHTPVLLNECISAMRISELPPGAVIIDGTFGAGGHTRRILG